jgi:putative ABC transport system substrate-binding protein
MRRDFITLIGGAVAAWPLGAGGQQGVMPVIGWLGTGWADTDSGQAAAFRKGLNEAGFVDGKNVSIIVGRRGNMTGCRHWPPIWFAVQ